MGELDTGLHDPGEGIYVGEDDEVGGVASVEPTRQLYPEMQQAYDWFNASLFEGKLPPVLLTLQRKHGTCTYWSPNRFATATGEKAGELAMNPRYFAVRTLPEVLSQLVHEQVHVWQTYHGKPGRRGYHNREWADKMKALGLQPTSTGESGGAEIGESVTHLIVPEGPFDRACAELVAQKHFSLSWYDRFPVVLPARAAEPAAAGGAETDGSQHELRALFAVQNAAAGVPGDEEAGLPPWEGTPQVDAAEHSAPAAQTSVSATVIAAPEDSPARMFPALALQVEEPPKASRARIKYQCPNCKVRVWGKATLQLQCMPCEVELQAQG